jgi:cell division septation protein DedD
MRNLFLALVLVNLAFAAWSAWFAPSEHAGHPINEGLPALTLVSEVPADLHRGTSEDAGAGAPNSVEQPTSDAAADAAPSAQPAAVAVSAGEEAAATEQRPADTEARCTSVGPFRELAQAAAAAATLRGEGYQPQQRVAEGEVWSGYWVYIPAIASEAEANETLAKVREGVREARIPDAYVIRNSDSGNLVSLGVFSEISGVSRLRDEVRALGYEPQVVDRMSRATVYWIDIALAPGQALDFDALQPPGRIIRLEQRACDSAPN